MQTLGSVAALCAAVREDAEVEAERTLAAAWTPPAPPPAPAGPAGNRERETRLAAARRAAAELIAHEDWLDARGALEDREAWLRRAAEEGRRRLTAPEAAPARRARLERLAAEALAALPPGPLDLLLAPEDLPLFAADRGASLRVIADPTVAPGGCLARSRDGAVSCDNGIEARARRFEPAWRSALGRLYRT